MFSSRRFFATLLIVTVFSAGLGLLPSSLVQNATANKSADLCDDYIETCEGYWDLAQMVCNFYGSDTYICQMAEVYALNWCDYYQCIFCWCA